MLDGLSDIFLSILESIFSGLAALIELLPSIPGMDAMATAAASIPESPMYFVVELGFLECLAAIVSAYGIRFLIRRIPFIG
jgi:hypothetical protein